MGTAFGLLSALDWRLDLFAHFKLQYTAALLAVCALLLALRYVRRAALFALFLILNLWEIAPYYIPTQRSAAASPAPIRALYFNVNIKNTRYTKTLTYIEEVAPDIVLLKEIDDAWLEAVRPLHAALPHQLATPRGEAGGIALFSRWPIKAGRIVHDKAAVTPNVLGTIVSPLGPVRIIGAHAVPPMSAKLWALRNGHLRSLSELADDSDEPTLLLGDLNVTPWSHHFKTLGRRANLNDCALGSGVQLTWPTTHLLARIAIDHCLRSPEIEVLRKWVGPDLGSDHFPNVVEFRI